MPLGNNVHVQSLTVFICAKMSPGKKPPREFLVYTDASSALYNWPLNEEFFVKNKGCKTIVLLLHSYFVL